MTVQQNVEYGLRVRKVAEGGAPREGEPRRSRVVRLEGYGDRKPGQLSGGQRQRVALARAIVNTPRALLLDEPLGALDLKLRQELQIELKQLQQELGMTFVYVTHDQEEALTMSDRIAVFNQRADRAGRHAGGDVRAPGDDVRRRLHRHVEHPRARTGGRSPCARRRSALLPVEAERGRAGHGPRHRLPRAVDEVRRRARRRRRADGGAAEPRDEIARTSIAMEGRRVRLHWRPDVEFAIEEEGT